MGKARFILTLLFVLTLSSGVVAGMLVTRWPASPGPGPVAPTPRTALERELDLTAEQSKGMKSIWESVRGKVDDCYVRAQAIQKKREDAIYALLTDEQKAKVAAAQKDYTQAIDALKSERKAAFDDAVNRTKAMLSESQRKRYDEILAGRLHRDAGTGDWLSGPASRPE